MISVKNKNKSLLLVFGALTLSVITIFMVTFFRSTGSDDTRLRKQQAETDSTSTKIFRQKELEDKARSLIRRGDYGTAINVIEQAMDPSLQTQGYNTSIPHFLLRKVYWLEGRYEEALAVLEPLLKVNPAHQPYVDEKLEYEALIHARDSNTVEPIVGHINYLKERYSDRLPPQSYTLASITPIVTILRLYDTIGDHDAGIAYIDGALAFLKKQKSDRGENAAIYDQIKTAEQAKACAGLDIFPVTDRHPEWRACKLIREFLVVREAFEKEKAATGPTCGDWGRIENPEPGQPEYCIGDATRALIQSNYFPW